MKNWLKSTLVECIVTFSEVMSSGIIITQAINEINWFHMLLVSATSVIMTILYQLKNIKEVVK